MKYAPSTNNIDSQLFGVLLMPSWLSSITSVSASILIIFGTIVLSVYQASSIRLDFLHYQAGHIDDTYRTISTHLSSNVIIGNLPLLIFWSLVGLVVYLFVISIFGAISNTAELTSELHYVHAQRSKLIWTACLHLMIRSVVLVVWGGYIFFFMHHIVPYCIAASLAGAAHFSALQSFAYVLLAMIVMVVALHIHVILLRLLLMKPRVFTSVLYVD